MFFIAGLTTRSREVGTGTFVCPNEGGTRRYRHLQSRRWFTLFFVPLVPLNRRGDWVQCLGCGITYRADILDRNLTGRN
ncbi:MAG TPA: hypothetical protein VK891_03230 [Euzebyales bacterium]|nr:hypothetical protein [Euzebyales bacterium]